MRRLISSTILALTILALSGTGVAVADSSLTASGVPAFPERTWILTLPRGVTVAAADVLVHENGRAVRNLQVSPADGGTRHGLGVVLAIDTSESMAGTPIADAMAAARSFARQRAADQPLAIVTFDSVSRVILAPTTDAQKIAAALAVTPPLNGGTHLFDAAQKSVDVLRRAGHQAGAVVVLSDGSDRGSVATAASVAIAAARAHTRVFTVGLQSELFESRTLRSLAGATQGEYLGAATGAGLARLYRDLGGQLANAYVVRYRSLRPAGAQVHVRARVGGLLAEATYKAPTLAAVARARSADRAAAEPAFFGTTAGIAIVAVVALLAIFLVLWALIGSGGRDRDVRDRVRDYGSSVVPDQMPDVAPEKARRARSQERDGQLAELLEISGLEASPSGYRLATALTGLVLSVLLVALASSVLVAPVGLIVAGVGARTLLLRRVARQRARFAEQLADGLQAVASAMRTGQSFAGALAVLAEDAGEPMATEVRRVIADERIGKPLEEALGEMARRMDNRDIDQVTLVAVLQRETGGNGAEALDRVVDNLRGRDEVRRLIKTLTAQGELSRWILSALPVALVALLTAISPDYMAPLFDTRAGHSVMVLAALLVVAGSVAIKRLITIEV